MFITFYSIFNLHFDRKNICLKENKKLLDVLLKEKKNLENRQEELESQKIVDLEEKLVKVKRLYGEMKLHLVTVKFCLKK